MLDRLTYYFPSPWTIVPHLYGVGAVRNHAISNGLNTLN